MEDITQPSELFSILDTTDSTNNYAATRVHEGLARHGEAWFALEQTAGKGQRGKAWESSHGENILLSIILRPNKAFAPAPFLLSLITTDTCRLFLSHLAGESIQIKWPNDLYWRDRKTGGILVENIFRGTTWDWTIIGVGLNINQIAFPALESNPISLKQITGQAYDPELLARKLHRHLVARVDTYVETDVQDLLMKSNTFLYKRFEVVRLKKENAVFETKVTGINEYGELMTYDSMARTFKVGEVAWVK